MGKRRELYKKTLLFEPTAQIPMYINLARESTLNNWYRQGLKPGMNYEQALSELLGINPLAFVHRSYAEVSFALNPTFSTKIISHQNGHYVIRDGTGALIEISDRYDASYLSQPKDFVTRRWLHFPVTDRKSWEEMKQRYDPRDDSRLPKDFSKRCKKIIDRDEVLILSFNGVFWQLREWCGFENLCIMMIEQPEFVEEMARFWESFVSTMLRRVLPLASFDGVFISEDMAYKAHAMISPKMVRQFILPAYFSWVPLIRNSGCALIELDSDGCVDELIPLFLEAGINCFSPIEVAAHCDIVQYRKLYGKQMAFLQGIDKRTIAAGGKAMEKHVSQVVNALSKDGGFIPGCDHGVPNDVTWDRYMEYTGFLAHLCGWI